MIRSPGATGKAPVAVLVHYIESRSPYPEARFVITITLTDPETGDRGERFLDDGQKFRKDDIEGMELPDVGRLVGQNPIEVPGPGISPPS